MLYIGFLYIQRKLDNFSHIPKSASSSSSSWLDSSHVSILIESGSSVSSEILFDAISDSFPSSLISASISKPCAFWYSFGSFISFASQVIKFCAAVRSIASATLAFSSSFCSSTSTSGISSFMIS